MAWGETNRRSGVREHECNESDSNEQPHFLEDLCRRALSGVGLEQE